MCRRDLDSRLREAMRYADRRSGRAKREPGPLAELQLKAIPAPSLSRMAGMTRSPQNFWISACAGMSGSVLTFQVIGIYSKPIPSHEGAS
jgi:hypothetical protein